MDRRLARTKRNIRKAMLTLIKKKSVDDITITELSELADIDRRTFYAHYGTVMDVIYEMETEIASQVREILSSKETLDIKDILTGLNEIMDENRDFYKQISSNSHVSFLKEQCKDILKQELQTAYYKKSGLTKDIFNIHAEYVSSGILGAYTQWLARDNGMSLSQLTEIIAMSVEDGWRLVVGNK